MSIRRPSIHIPLFPCGVGSLPQTDPDAAVASVLQTYWRMPFWPQLPNRDPAEQMIPQAGLDLPGASWDGQLLHWSGTPSDAALADVGLPPPERAAGLHAFIAALEAMPADQRPTVIKGQIVGPLTLSMLTRDANGAAPHDDPQTLLWLARLIGRAGAAQVQRLQELVPHVVLVFDEPALASVEEPLLPLTWRATVEVLRETLAPVQALGAIAGLHSCAPPDWTRVLKARPNLIHFDGREGRLDDLVEHKSALREHVARGGYLGWGLWPTDFPKQPFDPKAMQYYLAKAAREIAFVDASMGAIFKRSFLSGVCGGAGLTTDQASRMGAELEEMSMGIRKRYWIAATTDVDPDDPLS
ncbi:MAG: hypothetical protein DK306_000652 [Chloroflexi bacterium]|nr:MAG: hypothetical protein DK306_000652 [Chloroflexota bacterium]